MTGQNTKDPHQSNYDTADLRAKDRQHIIHPWIDLGTAKTREPMVIAESEGAYVYDTDGRRMLDGIGGMWCVNIGHAREEMAQAIADQVRIELQRRKAAPSPPESQRRNQHPLRQGRQT